MSYQALYRKFRPKDFDEVCGQEAVVTTLKNQLKSGRTGHAYIFSGTRGTGKTSIAKIFARAVNCEAPKEGNPCGECPSCKKISSGASLNVFEIDGASNNGVENIRTIIEDLSYPPVEGKYKVYIIDEAHMVSGAAFNALLKTIEEPPEYAVFILATTEINRIPVTIHSRCQCYEFRRITADIIAGHLRDLCVQEGISIEDRAVKYIARLADGSMRDSLSMLDQVASYYQDREVTFDMTLEMLGTVDVDVFSKLYGAICSRNISQMLKLVDDAIMRGVEPETFVSDFTWYLRNLLLVKNGEKLEEIADISSDNVQRFENDIGLADNSSIMHCITKLSMLVADLKYAPLKRITLEIGLMRLCVPEMDDDNNSLLERINRLEKRLESPAVSEITVPRTAEPEKPEEPEPFVPRDTEPEESGMSAPPEEKKTAVDPDADLNVTWKQFIQTIPASERFLAEKAVVVSISKDKCDIYFDEAGTAGRFYGKPANSDRLKADLKAFLGYDLDVGIKIVSAVQIPDVAGKADEEIPAGDDFFKAMENTGFSVEIED